MKYTASESISSTFKPSGQSKGRQERNTSIQVTRKPTSLGALGRASEEQRTLQVSGAAEHPSELFAGLAHQRARHVLTFLSAEGAERRFLSFSTVGQSASQL